MTNEQRSARDRMAQAHDAIQMAQVELDAVRMMLTRAVPHHSVLRMELSVAAGALTLAGRNAERAVERLAFVEEPGASLADATKEQA